MCKDLIQQKLATLDTKLITVNYKKINKILYNKYPFKLNLCCSPYLMDKITDSMQHKNHPWFNTARNIYFKTCDEILIFLEDLIVTCNKVFKHKHNLFIILTLTIPDDQTHLDELVSIQQKIKQLETDNKSNLNTKFINKKSPKENYNSRVVLTMNTYRDPNIQQDVWEFIDYMKDMFEDAVVFNENQFGYSCSKYYFSNMDFKMYIYLNDPDDAVMLIPHTTHKFVKNMKTEVFLHER